MRSFVVGQIWCYFNAFFPCRQFNMLLNALPTRSPWPDPGEGSSNHPGDEVPKSITLLVEDLVAAAGSKTIVDFVPYYHLR